jgi:hypothetical protein
MYLAPFFTQRWNGALQRFSDLVDLSQPEAKTFTQFRRTFRAIQDEYRLTVGTYHMNMRRAVIVGPDHDPQATDAIYYRHVDSYQKPKR